MRARAVATSFLIRLSFSPPPLLLPTSLLYSSSSCKSLGSASHVVSAMSTTSTTPSPASSRNNNVRVVSYNLLSSKLARSSHFTHADPDHLQYERRLPMILDKLDEAMERSFGSGNESDGSSPPPTVFALQEVCYPFASELHAFFAQRGYHFVTGLYGRPFNGYMGVGLAYPLKDFETVNVDICRLSDKRPGGWPREKFKGETGVIQKFTKTLETLADFTIRMVANNRIVKRLGYGGKKEIDPWEMSQNRFNVMLTAVLRFRNGDPSTFSISNYHMPCAFYAPAVMNIHSEMAARRVQRLATTAESGDNKGPSETIPYIFAGDFNILPDSPHYKLLTTAELDESDPTYPPPKFGEEWKIESLPMDSAYAVHGSEPEFTNYAHCREDPDPFVGTLDYIFLSKKEQTCSSDGEGNESRKWWVVRDVQKLPCKEDSGGPAFPNEKQPSDHYLISADLELVSV